MGLPAHRDIAIKKLTLLFTITLSIVIAIFPGPDKKCCNKVVENLFIFLLQSGLTRYNKENTLFSYAVCTETACIQKYVSSIYLP